MNQTTPTPTLTSDPYRLERGDAGLTLTWSGRSVLGPLRFCFEVEDLRGRRYTLSGNGRVEAPARPGEASIRLSFSTDALPSGCFEVELQLSEEGLTLTPSARAGTTPLRLRAFRVTARPTPASWLAGVGEQPGWRVLGAGYNSFSPSFSRDSRDVSAPPLFPTAGIFNQHTESPYWAQREALSSPWMAAFTPHPSRRPVTVLLGFLSATSGLGEVAVLRDKDPRLEARLGWDGRLLQAEATLVGDALRIAASEQGDELLDAWTHEVARRMDARSPRGEIPSGWCSWYYYYTAVSERAVLGNLASLSQARARLPVRYVQLDDGYQTKIGDWLSLNEKFPSGLAVLGKQIRAAGFVPGIWTAPFLVQRSSRVFREHPGWLLRGADGELRRLGYHPPWGVLDGQVYSLDPTHPEVQAWLSHVFRTLCQAGFDYFKIDFLFAGLRVGRHHDPEASPVEAYRAGLRCIREAIGDRFLLGCGAPLLPSVGFMDAMRISSDVKEAWRDPWVSRLAGSAGHPAAELAILNCLTRARLHGALWINDPDCLLVRRDRSALSLAEVQTLLSVLSLTGGMLFLSDDLRTLDEDRRALAELALPPAGEAARVEGALVEERPARFVRRRALQGGGVEALAAVIHWGDGAKARGIHPVELGLPRGDYHAYEFWSRRYQRLSPDEPFQAALSPHGTALLLLRPAAPRPALVTVTHHLGQTTVLVEREAWDAEALTLTVTLRALAAREGDALFALPPPFRLGAAEGSAGLSVGPAEAWPAGARVRVAFTAAGGTATLTLRLALREGELTDAQPKTE